MKRDENVSLPRSYSSGSVQAEPYSSAVTILYSTFILILDENFLSWKKMKSVELAAGEWRIVL